MAAIEPGVLRPGDSVRVAPGRTIKGKFQEGMLGVVVEDRPDCRNCIVSFGGEDHTVGYRFIELAASEPQCELSPRPPTDARSSPKSPRKERLSASTPSEPVDAAIPPRSEREFCSTDAADSPLRPSSVRSPACQHDPVDASRAGSDAAKRVRCDGWEDKRGLKATSPNFDSAEVTTATAEPSGDAQALLERVRELEDAFLKIKGMCSKQTPDVDQVRAILKSLGSESSSGEDSGDSPQSPGGPTAVESDPDPDTIPRKLFETIKEQLAEAASENQRLQRELHDKTFEVRRLERISEKELEDGVAFVKQIAKSSSSQTMGRRFDMDTIKILGMGNYGFVVTARDKNHGAKAVIKLQSERWAAVAMKEWGHGVAAGVHPNIVEYVEAFMHQDEDHEIARRLMAGFDDGTLTGKRPRKFPECFFCIALEYMDRGTVHHLVEKELLSLEGVGAITRQVASALAFLHRQKRTHNDIKPENILLREEADSPSGALVAKLADFGLADHSTDRLRDRELFGYTMWCCALGRRFGSCPQTGEEQWAALTAFSEGGPSASEESPRRPAARDERKIWRAMEEVVGGMWGETLDMQQVEDMPRLAGLEITLNVSGERTEEITQEIKREARRATVQNMKSCHNLIAIQHTGLTIQEESEESEGSDEELLRTELLG